MSTDDKDQSRPIFVTSHNQQGGITANQVHIGLPQRDLRQVSSAERQGLLDAMEPHRNKVVGITVSVNDSEVQRFANQIRQFLGENGFDVKRSIASGFFSKPQPPLSIDSRRDDEATVIIGPNNPNFPG